MADITNSTPSPNFELNTLAFIESLGLDEAAMSDLIRLIEWEKEISWSEGYEACEYTVNE